MPIARVIVRVSVLMALTSAACSGGDEGTRGDASGDADPNNAAPTVVIETPLPRQRFQPGDPVSVSARVADEESRAEALVVTIDTDDENTTHTVIPSAGGIAAREIAGMAPGVHTIAVTATDPGGKSGTASVEVEIDGPSTGGAVTIAPADPRTDDDLLATLATPFADTFDTALVVAYRWSVDDQETAHATNTVLRADTQKGETWKVVASARDVAGNVGTASASVTIANTAPACDLVTILPSNGNTNTDFTCQCALRTDPDDDDPVADRCEFRDGERTVAGAVGCSLPASATSPGMVLTCVLTPDDGDDAGTPKTSGQVIVANEKPTKPGITLSPAVGGVETLFMCNLATPSTDLEGASVSYETTWVLNDYANPGSGTAVVPFELLRASENGEFAKRGDRLACRTRAYDGALYSETAESAIIVLANTPPDEGRVTITPPQPDETATLTCVASGAIDADRDPITWHYTWDKNGAPVLDASGAPWSASTLPPSEFAVGDSILCHAAPFDGIDAGTVVDAKFPVTIHNVAPSAPVVSLLAPAGGDGAVTCQVDVAATDHGVLTSRFWWSVNGGAEVEGSAILADAAVGPCNVVTCRQEVSDGIDTTSSATALLQMPVGSCADDNGCTAETCSAEGACVTTNTTDACVDGDPCTTDDRCSAGACHGVAKDCDDHQHCTTDACHPESGQCLHETAADTLCDDHESCTADSCDAAADAGHGACVNAPLSAVPCDADGDGCTVNDACVSGECVAGGAHDCTSGAGAEPCRTRTCESTSPVAFTCTVTPFAETVGCDDGKYCTVTDHCDGVGGCIGGAARDCTSTLGVCRTGACDEDANTCQASNKPDTALCDFDQDGCTIGDHCLAGACARGADADCSDLDGPCGTGTCVSIDATHQRCDLTPIAEGLFCDDGLFCSTASSCKSGHCAVDTALDCDAYIVDHPALYPDFDAQCQTGTRTDGTSTCDEGLDTCAPIAIADGIECDDGDACTVGDVCQAGHCTAGASQCLEEPLSLITTATSNPALLSMGDGGYLASWRRAGQYSGGLRFVDAQGSHLGEESLFATDELDLGRARKPRFVRAEDGAFYGVYGDGTQCCTKSAFTNCSLFSYTLATRRYFPWTTPYVVAGGWTALNLQTAATADSTTTCQGGVTVPLAYVTGGLAGSYAIVHATEYTYDGATPPTSFSGTEAGKILYRPIAFDLSTSGDPVTIVSGVSGVTGPPLSYVLMDAQMVPGSNDFVVVWLDATKKQQAARFKGASTPTTLRTWMLADYGATDAFGNIADTTLRTVAGGGFAAIWSYRDSSAGTFDVIGKRGLPDGTFIDLAVHPAGAAGNQRAGGIATFSDGTFIATYAADGVSGTDIYAQVLSGTGQAVGAPRLVNTTTLGDQALPTVEVLPDDDYVVAWVAPDGAVIVRRFHPSGAPASGRIEHAANQLQTELDQESPAGAADGAGAVLVAWDSASGGPSVADVVVRFFDETAVALAPEVRANAVTLGAQRHPAVSGANGQFLVAWDSDGQDGSGRGVYARLFDAGIGPTSAEFALAIDKAGDQDQPSVALRADGTWLATWIDKGGLVGRTGQGATPGPTTATIAASGAAGNAVAARADGLGYVVAWLDGANPTTARCGLIANDGTFAPESVASVEYLNNATLALAVAPSGAGGLCWTDAYNGGLVACRPFTIVANAVVLADVPATVYQSYDRYPAGTAATFLTSGRPLVGWQTSHMDSVGLDTGIQIVALASDFSAVAATGGMRAQANRFRVGDQTDPFFVTLPGDATVDRVFVGWRSEGQDGDGGGVFVRALDFSVP